MGTVPDELDAAPSRSARVEAVIRSVVTGNAGRESVRATILAAIVVLCLVIAASASGSLLSAVVLALAGVAVVLLEHGR